jgi:hypothetical protein
MEIPRYLQNLLRLISANFESVRRLFKSLGPRTCLPLSNCKKLTSWFLADFHRCGIVIQKIKWASSKNLRHPPICSAYSTGTELSGTRTAHQLSKLMMMSIITLSLLERTILMLGNF